MSEDEKYRIQQIRDYADEYIDLLEHEIHSDLTECLIRDAIEDAVRWADSHPKNKIEEEIIS